MIIGTRSINPNELMIPRGGASLDYIRPVFLCQF